MKKMKPIKKRTLVASAAVLCLCVAALVGATFAWFTDTASTATNKIQSGNLDIAIMGDKGTGTDWSYLSKEESSDAERAIYIKQSGASASSYVAIESVLWEPGCTFVTEQLKVVNEGNLALKYAGKVVYTDDAAAGNKLAEVIDVSVVGLTKDGAGVERSLGTLASLISSDANVLEGELLAGISSDVVTLKLHMQESAGNDYKSLDFNGFKVVVEATQLASEYDSFSNQYDANSAGGEEEDDDESTAVWFDTSKTEDKLSSVLTIAFTKTVPAGAAGYKTWSAPYHTTAYYDETNKALTYVLNTGYEKLEFNDDNLLKFGANILQSVAGITNEEILKIWNDYATQEGKTTYSDLASFMASENGDSYGEEIIADILREKGLKSSDYAFVNVTSITGLNLWDVSKVTDFSYMFKKATNLTSLDLSGWDTSSAKNMHGMFDECTELETLTLGDSWNTSNVTNMAAMFSCCNKLQDIPTAGWDTSKVENMRYMFVECKAAVTIDLSSFDTRNVTNMGNMFSECSKLEHIYVGDYWSTAKVTASNNMFQMCEVLHNYDVLSANVTKAYVGEGGYLETKSA